MSSLQAVSVQDVIARLGVKVNELLQVSADTDVSSNPQLLGAVESANACVYGYIRTRYSMPRESNDPALKLYGCALVQYDLASNRADIFSEAHKTLRMDAIKFLEGVRDGKIQLSYPPENRNEAAAPGVLVGVGSTVDEDTYPTATNQSWFPAW